MVRRQAVLFALRPVHHHGSHHGAQAPGAALEADVLHCHDGAAAGAGCAGARHGPRPDASVVFPPLRRVAAILRHVRLHVKDDACAVRLRRHRQQHALVFLLAQPARLQQGKRGPALLAGNGARPEVGHRGLGDPTRVARVVEVGRVKLRVQRVDLRNAVFVNFQKL